MNRTIRCTCADCGRSFQSPVWTEATEVLCPHCPSLVRVPLAGWRATAKANRIARQGSNKVSGLVTLGIGVLLVMKGLALLALAFGLIRFG